MKVVITPQARRDITSAVHFVEVDNPAYARRLARAIRNTVQRIGERPYLGIRNVRAPDLRSRLVLGFPYRVHYLVRADEVRIVHIRHTARRTWEPTIEDH
jgi:toxin ParE1/3/4